MKDKRGRRIDLLSSCNLGSLFQKQVLETTARAIMVQRTIQGHRFSLTPLLPILRWGISYIFQYSSTALIDFIPQASFFKSTWPAFAMDFSSSFSCFLENQCSPLTFSPVSWKRGPSYCCLLQLWTQMEFMAFWVVFITVLKAWQMSSTKTPVKLFLPQALHASQLLQLTRQGSSAWCELLLL